MSIVADTGSWQTSDQFYRMSREETQTAKRGINTQAMIPAVIAGKNPMIFIDSELAKFENDPSMANYVAWLRERKEELQ